MRKAKGFAPITPEITNEELQELRQELTCEIYRLKDQVQVPELTERVRVACELGSKYDPKFASRTSGWGTLRYYLHCYKVPVSRVNTTELTYKGIYLLGLEAGEEHRLQDATATWKAVKPRMEAYIKSRTVMRSLYNLHGSLGDLFIEHINELAEKFISDEVIEDTTGSQASAKKMHIRFGIAKFLVDMKKEGVNTLKCLYRDAISIYQTCLQELTLEDLMDAVYA